MELRINDNDFALFTHDSQLYKVLDAAGFNTSKPIVRLVDLENMQVVFQQKDSDIDTGKISDGYHTFDELYYHRMILFAVICRHNRKRAWKSWKHEDGTMFDDYFVVGVVTKEGDYTYHYHKDHWELFKVPELEHAPKWDGHKPEDVSRLLYIKRR